MHRPTPNANDRLPVAPTLRMWGLALVLFLAAAALMESGWRHMGFRPSVTDGFDLWAYHREHVETAGPRTVVLLGRSRMQQQFSPEVWRTASPGYGYIQLAIGGKHPIGALLDIAHNTDFRGVVVVSATSPSLLHETWDQQGPYIDFYHMHWGPLRRSSRWLKTQFQARFTLLLPELLLHRVLPDLLRGNVAPQFLWTHPDRCQTVDYRSVDIDAFRRMQYKKIEANMKRYVSLQSYTDWPTRLGGIEEAVRRIHARGGRVVFLRCPTSGAYRELEARHFPRRAYWDVFAAQTSAATLHFEDMPLVRDMQCAEGTHLYAEDTWRFTAILATMLKEMRVLEPKRDARAPKETGRRTDGDME